jgi:UDP-2,4-diacetamido-2,4,6-trideoxy-beta-L-altropyranose hydrolase
VSEGTLVIRADANVEIGTGHVMRCLALAQAWQDSGGQCIFAIANVTPPLERRLLDEGMKVQHISAPAGSDEDATETANIARASGSGWTVVDGYHFDASYQSLIKESGSRLLFLDDHGHAKYYYADLVLNQNSDAQASLYADSEAYTQLLLGSRFVMLRREFEPWRKWERAIGDFGRRVLITMGGSDPDNLTLLVIDALKYANLRNLQVTVVVGGSNPHIGLLKSEITEEYGWIRIETDVTDMPALMASADIALIAAGGTLWELFFMGCSILSYARDVVQGEMISRLGAEGVLQDLGYPQDFDAALLAEAIMKLAMSPERRSQISLLGRQRVDGNGAGRVCEHLMAGTTREISTRLKA